MYGLANDPWVLARSMFFWISACFSVSGKSGGIRGQGSGQIRIGIGEPNADMIDADVVGMPLTNVAAPILLGRNIFGHGRDDGHLSDP